MAEVDYADLPFDEAIKFFRGKLNLPTEKWTDLIGTAHNRAFVVAGAMLEDLLADLRAAVAEAIETGSTLQAFKKRFVEIAARYGWAYKGKPAWRAGVIYDTNLRQSYNAGRWQQMTSPESLKSRPYLEYVHGDSITPRPDHLGWNGITLPADDPWWATHYPSNGFGCKCRVFPVGERDLARMGKTGPDTAPDNGTYRWKNPSTGEVEIIPNGIDPGFDYNPGEKFYDPKLKRPVK